MERACAIKCNIVFPTLGATFIDPMKVSDYFLRFIILQGRNLQCACAKYITHMLA